MVAGCLDLLVPRPKGYGASDLLASPGGGGGTRGAARLPRAESPLKIYSEKLLRIPRGTITPRDLRGEILGFARSVTGITKGYRACEKSKGCLGMPLSFNFLTNHSMSSEVRQTCRPSLSYKYHIAMLSSYSNLRVSELSKSIFPS